MSKSEKSVKIGKAKGRPMLSWVGKRPLARVKAYPAQHVENFSVVAPEVAISDVDWSDWPDKFPKGGLLFHGDNKDVLAYLLANGFRGKVKLIYIDPPFDSGADYVRKVKLRGQSGADKIDGEDHVLGEQIQYTDIWANDNYLQFIYERLILLRELLDRSGVIFVHCDSTKGHFLRCVLDEIFGDEQFLNEIIWSYKRWPSKTNTFQAMHDTLLFYAKDRSAERPFFTFYEEASESYLKRFQGKTQVLDEETRTRKITVDDETKGMPFRDVWDISVVAGSKKERTNYPTQKPEELIERILRCCSESDDLVIDCFAGSGTTAAVAQRIGRRWIGADINKGAIQTTAKRLQTVMAAQAKAANDDKQGKLVQDEDAPPKPAQLSFTTWRVNDYDLQIQHNEAVELACEFLGVTRKRTDGYFDGTQGKRLVKIIPFNHPLTPLDLEDLKKELEKRPEEERNILVVSLGIEIAARAWVEKHNRSRPINRIEVIELRSDPRYGGFFKHEPMSADVSIKKNKKNLVVEVTDVFSPTIVQRLEVEEGLFRAEIDDFRAVVDCVMIDTDYDGEVFNVALADVPARKQDLIQARYAIPAPRKGATVAVKVIDMLGEETVVTKKV